MHDPWTRITNLGTRPHKSVSNINTLHDVYHYITDGKLPADAKTQACIQAEALNYVVISNFLFRIDTRNIKTKTKKIPFY